MPKNRYDPLLFLPYSLSVACQGKTTPEPSGTRLSFETHRTGEFRKRPRSFKTRNSTHGESTKDPAEKGRKKAPNFSHQEFRRSVQSLKRRWRIITTRIASGFLQPYKGLLPAASKGAGFHSVQQCRYHFGLPFDGVGILACSQLILHDVMPFLLLDVFLYRWFIESYRTHIITFWPKIFCCRICTSSLRDYQKSSRNFCPSDIPWNSTRWSLAGYSPACEHDRA